VLTWQTVHRLVRFGWASLLPPPCTPLTLVGVVLKRGKSSVCLSWELCDQSASRQSVQSGQCVL